MQQSMKRQTIWKIVLMTVMMIINLILVSGLYVYAAQEDGISVNRVYEIAQETSLKAEDNQDAEEIASLHVGDSVIVTEYTSGEWCKVMSGGKEGYILITSILSEGDFDELDKEFESVRNDYINSYEESLMLEQQQKTSRIWGGIIVGLVIAIFLVGIVSALSKQRKSKESKDAT